MRTQLVVTSSVALAAVGVSIFREVYDYGRDISFRNEDSKKTTIEGNYEKLKIKNHLGLVMQGYLLRKPKAKQTLLILHPFDKSSKDMLPYVSYFENYFPDTNILLVDMIGHGNSDGYIRGFGYQDIADLMYWNTYILQKLGKDQSIIMYGKGMGANTILNTAGLRKLKNVKLIISEGAYDSVYHYLSYRYTKNKRLAPFIGPIIRNAIENELKVDIKRMDSRRFIGHNEIPTLFVHSHFDKDVDFNSVFELYNKCSSPKELIPLKEDNLYELDETDNYYQIFNDFISEYI